VAVAGDYRKAGFEYTGALQVLRTIMSYDYLWINVRVKGGAYGCMNSYTKFGPMYFASYRDPNLNETLKIFKEAEKYISEYSPDERDMNKYIIGTISNMDIPLTPRAKGLRSMIAYVTKTTYEKLQKERDEVLGAKAEDIRKLAGLVGAAIKDPVICVLGGEETIEKEASLFDKVETLL
jgi:Zn-dependent M16 (insulinase) family peptidase